MSVVTKTGDDGTTGLYGGKRVPKDAARIAAYGTVDELNASLGVALAIGEPDPRVKSMLTDIQHTLFRIGGDLATPEGVKEKVDRLGPEHLGRLEDWVRMIEAELPAQRRFILPGGTPLAALLHQSRTICRRAERETVRLEREEPVNPHVRVFLNRLSDFLFVLARKANTDAGAGDVEVRYDASSAAKS